MQKNKVVEYFEMSGMKDKIYEFNESSATVELAAQRLNCEPKKIAKTLALLIKDNPILIVAAGDAKVDNVKYREKFKEKAKMIQIEKLEELVGHKVGGVCPFCIKENVIVYLDVSLKRFEEIYPACGASNNAVKLTINQLEEHSKYLEWIDVCKDWN